MSKCTFKSLAESGDAEILVINGEVVARGIWVEDAVALLHDGAVDAKSYSDTGVFVLFRGSPARGAGAGAARYLDEAGRTTREFVFQSRNAAARFVLGPSGATGSWRPEA